MRDKNLLQATVDNTLRALSAEQRAQIAKQLAEHDYDQKSLAVNLSDNFKIQIEMQRNVLQPMSSQAIARFIFSKPEIFEDTIVYDIGTGSGLQAITAAIAGAKNVIASDISADALECCEKNIHANNVEDAVAIKKADLLDADVHKLKADWIIFAQPYFADTPITDFPVTSGMLDSGQLVPRFLQQAPDYLKPSGKILMLSWKLASEQNDPLRQSKHYPNLSIETVYEETNAGIQNGSVKVVSLEPTS